MNISTTTSIFGRIDEFPCMPFIFGIYDCPRRKWSILIINTIIIIEIGSPQQSISIGYER